MTDEAPRRQVAFIAHCLLNQNAKVDEGAKTPAMWAPVIALLRERGCVIRQMPCPELAFGGARRFWGVREQFDTPRYRSLWAGSPEATAEAIREASGGGVDYAIEATGRPEAMLAAFLSTRPRGAAVLIGIPREDAVLPLPAITIPRMERRVLGSIYGSSRPERDFPRTLELYRSGRLPLDRLVSHRLPLDEVERAFALMRSGEALRVVLDLTS